MMERDAAIRPPSADVLGDDVDGDPLAEPTVGTSALEKLCIAIIRAHPTQANDSRSAHLRLRDAIYALKGIDGRRGQTEAEDTEILLRMATLLKGAHIKAEYSARANLMKGTANDRKQRRDLVRKALNQIGEPVTEAALTRLSRKFAQKWEMLVKTADLASPLPHSVENRVLEKIVPLLLEIGIPAEMPIEPNFFWSLSSDK